MKNKYDAHRPPKAGLPAGSCTDDVIFLESCLGSGPDILALARGRLTVQTTGKIRLPKTAQLVDQPRQLAESGLATEDGDRK
jgi:hypothetical protein